MKWDYKREEQTFETIPVGVYRVRIKSAEEAISTSGNDMIKLEFEVNGYKSTLRYFISFLADRPEVTNRMLTSFFDSFGIDGDFNLRNWVGKVGAVQTKQEIYDGREYAKISYFIHKDKQGDLPPWKDNPAQGGKPDLTPYMGDDDLPF